MGVSGKSGHRLKYDRNTVFCRSDAVEGEGGAAVSSIQRAAKRLVKEIAREAGRLRPLAGVGLAGLLFGSYSTFAFMWFAVLPTVRTEATARGSAVAQRQSKQVVENAYFSGVLDAFEGRITAKAKYERAYLLVEDRGGAIRSLSVDQSAMNSLEEDGFRLLK